MCAGWWGERKQIGGEDGVKLHVEKGRGLLQHPVRPVPLQAEDQAPLPVHPDPQRWPARELALDVDHPRGPAGDLIVR